MEHRLSRWDVGSLLAILISILLVSVTSYLFMMHSVEVLIRKDAEQTGYEWVKSFSRNLPDMQQIAKGAPPSKKSEDYIKQARSIGRVFRFKLFDSAGQLRFIASEKENSLKVKQQIQIYHSDAYKAVVAGNSYTKIKEGTPPHRPTLYSETYLPILKNNKLIAIVEVYVDQSGKRFLFKTHFLYVATLMAFLIAVSFGLPAGLFYWKHHQKRKADKQLSYLARHDAMTGFVNRTYFLKGLEKKLQEQENQKSVTAIYYLDLDRLKEINDSMGHHAGDMMIYEASKRIKSIFMETNIIGRFGGDEFVVAQMQVADRNDAELYARRILDTIHQPFSINGREISTSISIGISLSPYDSRDPEKLIKRADLALSSVKSCGRNCYKFFEPQMDVELEARRKLEILIRNAAFEETFTLQYQPVFDIQEGRIISFEALLRLPMNEDQDISPAVFVPIAEEMGLINEIGAWVLKTACAAASRWPEDFRVAINLSPLQFKSEDIVNIVRSSLKDSLLDPSRLELEITESLLLNDTADVMKQLHELRSMGPLIVMDDFGTGYSSLSYLWQFKFDKIKIDQSFVKALNKKDDEILTILKTIIDLGHSLNMKVTTEGIETREQLELLSNVGCDQLQGYLFGKPTTEGDLAAMILNRYIEFADIKQETSSNDELAQNNQDKDMVSSGKP
ncbi:MAG: putative bifunctional diguanylate cyclase/phosphodiesterase [Methyloligellaceae bacterium]